jgi:hypothetical protein
MTNLKNKFYTDVVDLAYQIIDMAKTIERQEREIEDLTDFRDRYQKLLQEDIARGKQTVGMILNHLLLKDEGDNQNG